MLDNLYLDCNGIIHNCTHSEKDDLHALANRTETEMFSKVAHASRLPSFCFLFIIFYFVLPCGAFSRFIVKLSMMTYYLFSHYFAVFPSFHSS